MSIDYLKDYQDYYKARMDRYANDQDYIHSYNSEKAIYEAIASCSELGDFKEKLGNLNELNAVALVKDESKIRYNHYISIAETIRALGPKRIMERADNYNNVMDLITMVGEEENRNMIEISMDDIGILHYCWVLLERIEVYENADVPSSYRSEMNRRIEENKKSIREYYHTTTEERRAWQPDWEFNFDLVWEERHRRTIPHTDEELRMRIEQLKNIIK